jgi:hypothetical protein
VPIGYWLLDGVDAQLNGAYDKAVGNKKLKILKRSQKAGKGIVPQWQVKNWKEKYKIK